MKYPAAQKSECRETRAKPGIQRVSNHRIGVRFLYANLKRVFSSESQEIIPLQVPTLVKANRVSDASIVRSF